MMEDPRNISLCTHLLFCAKNIERIGDHATNIAENVYYPGHGKSIAGSASEGRHDQPAPCPMRGQSSGQPDDARKSWWSKTRSR